MKSPISSSIWDIWSFPAFRIRELDEVIKTVAGDFPEPVQHNTNTKQQTKKNRMADVTHNKVLHQDPHRVARTVCVAVASPDSICNVFEWAFANIFRATDKVVFLHVIKSSSAADPDVALQTQAKEVQAASPLITKCKMKNIEATFEFLRGDARDKIAEACKQHAADLLVVGSRGLGKLKRSLLGSVSEFLVLHAPCSVTVVRESFHGSNRPSETRRVGVAVDYPSLNSVFEFTMFNFLHEGDHVVFIHAVKERKKPIVVPHVDLLMADLPTPKPEQDEEERSLIAELHAHLRPHAVKLHPATCEALLVHGDARDALVKTCENYHIDSLVVGQRSMSTLKRLVVGSVSGHLVRECKNPVVMVKAPTLGLFEPDEEFARMSERHEHLPT